MGEFVQVAWESSRMQYVDLKSLNLYFDNNKKLILCNLKCLLSLNYSDILWLLKNATWTFKSTNFHNPSSYKDKLSSSTLYLSIEAHYGRKNLKQIQKRRKPIKASEDSIKSDFDWLLRICVKIHHWLSYITQTNDFIMLRLLEISFKRNLFEIAFYRKLIILKNSYEWILAQIKILEF